MTLPPVNYACVLSTKQSGKGVDSTTGPRKCELCVDSLVSLPVTIHSRNTPIYHGSCLLILSAFLIDSFCPTLPFFSLITLGKSCAFYYGPSHPLPSTLCMCVGACVCACSARVCSVHTEAGGQPWVSSITSLRHLRHSLSLRPVLTDWLD